jgi:hypothetical protein
VNQAWGIKPRETSEIASLRHFLSGKQSALFLFRFILSFSYAFTQIFTSAEHMEKIMEHIIGAESWN